MESLGFALISLVAFGLGIFPSDSEIMPFPLRLAFLIGGTLTGLAIVAH